MGRRYRVPYTGTLAASGGNADLLLILPADDKPCRLVGWSLGQSSEVGDAQEEDLEIDVLHMTATVTNGSGGSSVTPVPNRPGTDTAAGFTARCNDATVATATGTTTTVSAQGWNERSTPWEHEIPEERQPRCSQGEALLVRMATTPADDLTVTMTFYVEEEG
jgi:hypothetical protein